MRFLLLIGPPAVGKMTVGRELARLTGLKLFHNHMSIELVHHFFDFGTPAFSRLDRSIRFSIFREVAQGDLSGLIFTLVWAHNEAADAEYVKEILDIFREVGAEIAIVELRAGMEERLRRNRLSDRLEAKPTKRNLEQSEASLRQSETEYRMYANDREVEKWGITVVDNAHGNPALTARRIRDQLGW